jgi:hypothetical protein
MLRVAVAEIASVEEAMFGQRRRLDGPVGLRRLLQDAIETHFAGVGSRHASTLANTGRANRRRAVRAR